MNLLGLMHRMGWLWKLMPKALLLEVKESTTSTALAIYIDKELKERVRRTVPKDKECVPLCADSKPRP